MFELLNNPSIAAVSGSVITALFMFLGSVIKSRHAYGIDGGKLIIEHTAQLHEQMGRERQYFDERVRECEARSAALMEQLNLQAAKINRLEAELDLHKKEDEARYG